MRCFWRRQPFHTAQLAQSVLPADQATVDGQGQGQLAQLTARLGHDLGRRGRNQDGRAGSSEPRRRWSPGSCLVTTATDHARRSEINLPQSQWVGLHIGAYFSATSTPAAAHAGSTPRSPSGWRCRSRAGSNGVVRACLTSARWGCSGLAIQGRPISDTEKLDTVFWRPAPATA
jgi:hypothetical protein